MSGRRALGGCLAAAALATALLGCGKKGPPLPPLAGMVPRVSDLAVRQVGDEIHAEFSLPVRPGFEEVDYSIVAVELWRRPSESPDPESLEPVTPAVGAPAAPAPPPGRAQVEELPPVGEFTEGATMAVRLAGEELFSWLAVPAPTLVDRIPEDLEAPYLEYAVVFKTSVRNRGTLSNLAAIDPVPPPPRPEGLVAEAAEGEVRLSWTAGESEPLPSFNVYRAIAESAFPARPVNEKPLPDTSWTDADLDLGVTYRYLVRSVVEAEEASVESAPSDAVTVLYRDTFPPPTPEGLRLLAEGSRVNLLWNPVDVADLGGYAVYRRVGGGEWTRIDGGQARTATWVDPDVPADETVEYAVSSYDRAVPPNESPRSRPERISAQ